MSNVIPPGAIPKLWRQRNKDGKEVGSWYIHINKKPINLRSQDYMKARERAREAFYNGKRDFSDDRYVELPALPPMETAQPKIETPRAATGDWTADVVSAAGAGIRPDDVFTPGGAPEAERPKAEPILPQNPFAPSNDNTSKETPKVDGTTFLSPEMIEGFINQAAATMVELQLALQDWVAARWLKIEMGPVPLSHGSRKISEQIWHQAIREMVPENIPLPAWLVAPIATIMLTMPVQLEGAKPLKAPTEPVK